MLLLCIVDLFFKASVIQQNSIAKVLHSAEWCGGDSIFEEFLHTPMHSAIFVAGICQRTPSNLDSDHAISPTL